MDGTGVLFSRQQQQLANRFDICCLAIANDSLLGWYELVDLVLQLIETELAGSDRELHLWGESFGACLAMLVAAKMPVNGLILVNPASSFARLPLLSMGSFGAEFLPAPFYQLSARVLAMLLIEVDRVSPIDRQHLITAMLSVDARTAAWRLRLLREFQVDRVIPQLVDIPTLLLAGERDRLLPSKLETQILHQQLPKSQRILLPYSGHACLLEKDLDLAKLIL